MTHPTPRARGRQPPAVSDPPFLCSSCRHGHLVVQKLQPWLLDQEAWRDGGPGWFWRVTCRSAKITPWKFSVFCHPVVECDAFRARKIVTTKDLAEKQARKKRRKKKGKRKKRS